MRGATRELPLILSQSQDLRRQEFARYNVEIDNAGKSLPCLQGACLDFGLRRETSSLRKTLPNALRMTEKLKTAPLFKRRAYKARLPGVNARLQSAPTGSERAYRE